MFVTNVVIEFARSVYPVIAEDIVAVDSNVANVPSDI